jgi:two-component system response regulator NreC
MSCHAVPTTVECAMTALAQATEPATTIMLADDHAIVRSSLRMVLECEPSFHVIAEAGDVSEALRKIRAYKPRVALLDLSMPGGPSTAAIADFQAASPGTAIVFLTMEDEPALAQAALRAGAEGFVLKEQADGELVDAVRAVASGSRYLSPELGARIARMPDGPPPPPDNLTERELQVLRMIALGHTNAEIAQTLFLSVRTVESHRSHIQHKIGRNTRADLVAYAHEHQLVEPESAAQ